MKNKCIDHVSYIFDSCIIMNEYLNKENKTQNNIYRMKPFLKCLKTRTTKQYIEKEAGE